MNMKYFYDFSFLAWDQTFDAVYDASCMMNTKFHIGHLASGMAGMVNKITKSILMHPDTKFSDLYEEIAACVKTMEGQTIADGCSSLVFALRDNGTASSE